MQKPLSDAQIKAFYHDEFVEDQTRHFLSLFGRSVAGRTVTDVGGGYGFFAQRLSHLAGCKVKVVDTDSASVDASVRSGVPAVLGDALHPPITGDEDIVTLNLILHHLVGNSEKATLELQTDALAVWRSHVRAVFVNEYIYESFLPGIAGRLIYQITKSPLLSTIGRMLSAVAPSLRANTFGVGVRFRDQHEWQSLFVAAGYEVASSIRGQSEPVSLLWHLLLLKSIHRDSFLLQPRAA